MTIRRPPIKVGAAVRFTAGGVLHEGTVVLRSGARGRGSKITVTAQDGSQHVLRPMDCALVNPPAKRALRPASAKRVSIRAELIAAVRAASCELAILRREAPDPAAMEGLSYVIAQCEAAIFRAEARA